MRFNSAEDCLETFVYVKTSQGGPRGVTDDICIRVFNLKKKSQLSAGEQLVPAAGDNISMTNIYGEPLADYVVNLYNNVDFSSEDVMIFSVDIQSFLEKRFNDRERMALLIFGLMGASHGAEAFQNYGRYPDVRAYLEVWSGKEEKTPSPGGWSKLRMRALIGRFEDLLVEAGYMNANGKLALIQGRKNTEITSVAAKNHSHKLRQAA